MGRIQNTIAIPIYRVLPYPVIKGHRCVKVSSRVTVGGKEGESAALIHQSKPMWVHAPPRDISCLGVYASEE